MFNQPKVHMTDRALRVHAGLRVPGSSGLSARHRCPARLLGILTANKLSEFRESEILLDPAPPRTRGPRASVRTALTGLTGTTHH